MKYSGKTKKINFFSSQNNPFKITVIFTSRKVDAKKADVDGYFNKIHILN